MNQAMAVRAGDGLLSMCAWCRKVRDNSGEWGGVDPFLREQCRATHGICADCAIRVYTTEAERVLLEGLLPPGLAR